jgi:hypothetical protein
MASAFVSTNMHDGHSTHITRQRVDAPAVSRRSRTPDFADELFLDLAIYSIQQIDDRNYHN